MIPCTWRPATAWLFILALIVLHHDFWQWDRIEPLLWGWAPVALWYHVGVTLLSVAALYLLGHWVWPEPPNPELAGPDQRHTVPSAPAADANSEGSLQS